jgi:predicted N-acetyltransferase YhbS
MKYEVIHLPKEQWKGMKLPIEYTANEYYDVRVDKHDRGFSIEIEKASFAKPVTHAQKEHDFPDKLYEEHWEHAYAWGVVVNNKLIAAIETNQELWSNRLRVTELWVAELYRRQGIGHALMEVVKEQARLERRRAVILETQSCNVNAINFYMHEGFTLIGLDTCCYSNNDLDKKEVRLELGWFPEKKKRLKREDIIIREETKEDYYAVELLTQRAFWNKHQPGCDEHYLVYKLRQDKAYIPEISRIAVYNGEVIGCIMFTRARVVDEAITHEVITFGPLCVEPKWQGCGVGEYLLKETMQLAAGMGYKGIVIYGEPDYYPRLGFKTCDNFNITTPDGKNFDAFMAIELTEGGMRKIKGKFYEAEVFEHLPKEEVEDFNKKFPPLTKQKFPCQWM